MRKLVLVSSLLMLAGRFVLARVDGDVATSAGVSASPYSTFKDHKMVIPARDDLSAFVASGGAIRGVSSSSRSCNRCVTTTPGPYNASSDEDLANAILVHYEV